MGLDARTGPRAATDDGSGNSGSSFDMGTIRVPEKDYRTVRSLYHHRDTDVAKQFQRRFEAHVRTLTPLQFSDQSRTYACATREILSAEILQLACAEQHLAELLG